MGSKKRIVFIRLLFLFTFLISGCAPLAKLVVGKKGLEIPQIVAHIEPILKDNRITLSGKIVIQNPTETSLDLDKIALEIQDEEKNILEKLVLDWEESTVTSKQELESPVTINLSLSVLNKKSITVFIKTGFTYKKFGLHIPIESKAAVLHLESLKEAIARPFYVNILTKLRYAILRDSYIYFLLNMTNPLSIDLILEDGVIRISTQEDKDIAKTQLTKTVFKGSQSSEIKGTIRIGNIWSRLIRNEFIKRQPLKFEASGHFRIPDTDILIPFKIESVVDIKFSF